MERLTQRENDKLIMVKQDNGEYIPAYWDEDNFKAIKKLANYEDLEEQGLLVRSPCKIGDKIYRVNVGAKNPIIEMEIIQIEIRGILYSLKAIDKDGDELIYTSYSVGTTIFFNFEEAEKKLEELKNGK